MRFVIILFMVMIYPGCGTTKNTYIPPEDSIELTAVLKNTWIRNGAFDWEGFYVQSIDDKYISYSFRDQKDASNKIKAGMHKLSVYSDFNRTFGGPCPCRGFADVEFNFEPGKTYSLSGKINGSEINLFIIDDETGKQVSETIKTKFASKPKDNYVPILIFIPNN